MKAPLIGTALVFAITFNSFSQNPGYREDTVIPTFDLNFLIIKSSDKSEKVFKFLNAEMIDFLEEFPDPDKNEDFNFEISEEMARLIAYEASELYFLEDKLSDFRFQDPKFSLGNGESFIKVGDHYSLVEKIFPSYKIDMESDYLTKNKYGVIRITLSNGEIVYDEGLIFAFNLETEKTTEILL